MSASSTRANVTTEVVIAASAQPCPNGIRFGDLIFSEPAQLRSAKLPHAAGLFALLRHHNSWQPRPYEAVWFGEAGDLQEALETWAQIAPPNVYVAFCPMLFASREERRAATQMLSSLYRVQMVGPNPATFDHRLNRLEERCEQQADQLRVLVATLSKLVPPELPDRPRRPIGFVPETQ